MKKTLFLLAAFVMACGLNKSKAQFVAPQVPTELQETVNGYVQTLLQDPTDETVMKSIDKNKLRPFLTLDRCTQSTQECIDCEVAEGCAWCQGENYDAAETPTIFQRATAICKMHKARVRANNYYWNKLYHKLEKEGGKE